MRRLALPESIKLSDGALVWEYPAIKMLACLITAGGIWSKLIRSKIHKQPLERWFNMNNSNSTYKFSGTVETPAIMADIGAVVDQLEGYGSMTFDSKVYREDCDVFFLPFTLTRISELSAELSAEVNLARERLSDLKALDRVKDCLRVGDREINILVKKGLQLYQLGKTLYVSNCQLEETVAQLYAAELPEGLIEHIGQAGLMTPDEAAEHLKYPLHIVHLLVSSKALPAIVFSKNNYRVFKTELAAHSVDPRKQVLKDKHA